MAGQKSNNGDETEDLVESISGVMFLKDFVVRNPKFRKRNGQEKELSDILVPFEDVLLSIQAKSKVVNVSNTDTETIRKRIAKIIEDGIGQLRNTRRIVNEGKLLTVTNVHGINIPLNASTVKKIHGIVIVKIYGAGDQVNIPGGFEYKHDMSIHIFSAEDFEIISTEIDTIPDFIRYLDARAELFHESKINPDARELDLLTIHKTQPQLIDEILDNSGGFLVVNPGIWKGYVKDKRDQIEKRNELNRPSYLVDLTIEELSKSIDYAPDALNPSTGQKMEEIDPETYWKAVYELSKLSRLDRRIIGGKMLEKARQADTKIGEGYTMAMYGADEAILFYSVGKISRQERVDRLYKLAVLAYLQKNLNKIIAIATEPFSGPGRSFDLMFLEGVSFENAEEILSSAPRVFSDPKSHQGFEYTGEERI